MVQGCSGTIMCPARATGGACSGSRIGFVAAPVHGKSPPRRACHFRRSWDQSPSVNETVTHQERRRWLPRAGRSEKGRVDASKP